MKKLLIACSMVCAVALAVCAEDSTPTVTGTPKTTAWPWFTASATATNSGSFATIGDSTINVVDGESDTKLFEIDSELDAPVTFTPTDSLTQSMAKVSFKLSASFVPEDSLVIPSSPAKIGFAIHQTNETDDVEVEAQNVFKAWVGGTEWIRLTGATVTNENALYDMSVEIDNRDNKKLVRFSVGAAGSATMLTNDAGLAWIPYTTEAVTNTVAINFVGAGKVQSFGGDQLQFIAEIVSLTNGTIEVKAEDKAAFAETIKEDDRYTSVDEFIAAPAATAFNQPNFREGLAVGEAYAIGLVVKDTESGKMVPVNDGKIEVKADAQAATTDGIKLNLNIAPPPKTETGATVTYQLQGSTDGANYSDIDGVDAVGSQDAIVIPADKVGTGDGQYRYFKVKTIVSLASGDPTQSTDNP